MEPAPGTVNGQHQGEGELAGVSGSSHHDAAFLGISQGILHWLPQVAAVGSCWQSLHLIYGQQEATKEAANLS